jgi:hypothetical protein
VTVVPSPKFQVVSNGSWFASDSATLSVTCCPAATGLGVALMELICGATLPAVRLRSLPSPPA